MTSNSNGRASAEQRELIAMLRASLESEQRSVFDLLFPPDRDQSVPFQASRTVSGGRAARVRADMRYVADIHEIYIAHVGRVYRASAESVSDAVTGMLHLAQASGQPSALTEAAVKDLLECFLDEVRNSTTNATNSMSKLANTPQRSTRSQHTRMSLKIIGILAGLLIIGARLFAATDQAGSPAPTTYHLSLPAVPTHLDGGATAAYPPPTLTSR